MKTILMKTHEHKKSTKKMETTICILASIVHISCLNDWLGNSRAVKIPLEFKNLIIKVKISSIPLNNSYQNQLGFAATIKNEGRQYW